MARLFTTDRMVIASHNAGKVREIAELLAPFGVAVVSAGELGLPEPVEDGNSFIANAELKARASASASGLPALADDSGIAVRALGGGPGIHSARYAENPATGERDFDWGMQRLNEDVAGTTDRTAEFVSAISIAWPDGHCESFEGRVGGVLIWPPRGANGFGYDAMFLPNGKAQTFGEMAPEAKHAISHRAVAFRLFIEACFAGRG